MDLLLFNGNKTQVNYKETDYKIEDIILTYQNHSAIVKSTATVKYQMHQVKALLKYFDLKKIIYVRDVDESIINDLIMYSRKTCKNITINKRLMFLKLVYRYFNIDFPYLLQLRKLRQDLLTYDIIAESDLRKMMIYLSTFDESNLYRLTWKLIIYLLFDTGVRQSELLEIKIKNISLDQNMIKLESTKTKKERYVFFSKLSADLLAKYIKTQPEREYLLFNYMSFRPFTYRNLEHMFDHFKRKLNINTLHAHMFRHTMATLLVEHGCPLDSLQMLLGHSNISTTQIYLHMSVKKTKTDYERAFSSISSISSNFQES